MKSIVIVLFVLILNIFNLNGQKLLDLEECISIAQENSLSVKQSYLAMEDANIQEKYARQQLLPSLSASTDLSYNIGRSIDPTTNDFLTESFTSQRYNLTTLMTLYNGNRLRNSIKKAMMDKKASVQDMEQMKRDIALLVANTYLSILYGKEKVVNAKKQYNSTKEQLEKINKLIDAGLQAPSASLDLEAQLLADEQAIISAKNDLEKFYLDLKNILLLPDSQEIEIVKPNIDIDKLVEPQVKTLNELYNASLQHYPAFSAAELRIKSAEYQRKIANSALLPSIGFYAGVSTNYADKAKKFINTEEIIRNENVFFNGQEVTIGFPVSVPVYGDYNYFDQVKDNLGTGLAIQVNIPIYNRYSVKSQIQRSKLNIESAKISRERVVQDVKTNIQTALSEQKSAKQQYLASQKTFEARKRAFENSTKQYNTGTIGTYEYLNSKTLYEQAQNTLVISKYQYLFRTKILEFYLGENLSFKN